MQQLFIFLVAVIAILATVFIGSKLFKLFADTGCDASDAEFINSMKRTLNENSAFGSRNQIRVSAPCDAEQICFVDTASIPGNIITDNPTINQTVTSGVQTNMFIKKDKGTLAVGYDERIGLANPDSDLCINVTGGDFVFKTEGYGRSIILDRP